MALTREQREASYEARGELAMGYEEIMRNHVRFKRRLLATKTAKGEARRSASLDRARPSYDTHVPQRRHSDIAIDGSQLRDLMGFKDALQSQGQPIGPSAIAYEDSQYTEFGGHHHPYNSRYGRTQSKASLEEHHSLSSREYGALLHGKQTNSRASRPIDQQAQQADWLQKIISELALQIALSTKSSEKEETISVLKNQLQLWRSELALEDDVRSVTSANSSRHHRSISLLSNPDFPNAIGSVSSLDFARVEPTELADAAVDSVNPSNLPLESIDAAGQDLRVGALPTASPTHVPPLAALPADDLSVGSDSSVRSTPQPDFASPHIEGNQSSSKDQDHSSKATQRRDYQSLSPRQRPRTRSASDVTSPSPGEQRTRFLESDDFAQDTELGDLIEDIARMATALNRVPTLLKLLLRRKIYADEADRALEGLGEGLSPSVAIIFFLNFAKYNDFLRDCLGLELEARSSHASRTIAEHIPELKNPLTLARHGVSEEDAVNLKDIEHERQINKEALLAAEEAVYHAELEAESYAQAFRSYREAVTAANQRMYYITELCRKRGLAVPEMRPPTAELETSFAMAAANERISQMDRTIEDLSHALKVSEKERELQLLKSHEEQYILSQKMEAQALGKGKERVPDDYDLRQDHQDLITELRRSHSELNKVKGDADHARLRLQHISVAHKWDLMRALPSPLRRDWALQERISSERLADAKRIIRMKNSELARLREEVITMRAEPEDNVKEQKPPMPEIRQERDKEDLLQKSMLQSILVRLDAIIKSDPKLAKDSEAWRNLPGPIPPFQWPFEPQSPLDVPANPIFRRLQTLVIHACTRSCLALGSDPSGAYVTAAEAERAARQSKFPPLLGLCNYRQGQALHALKLYPHEALAHFKAAKRRGVTRYNIDESKIDEHITMCKEQIAREGSSVPSSIGELESMQVPPMQSAERILQPMLEYAEEEQAASEEPTLLGETY